MVSSGLEGTMLDVASYRLAVHLGLAFLILGLIAWFLMLLGRSERDLLQARRVGEGRLAGLTAGLLALAGLQVLLGALVAGIDAGRSFIDWPLMEGAVFPPDMWSLTPVWRNFFENAGLVQFNHRLIAYLLLAVGLVVWRISRSSPNPLTKRAFDWMAVMLFGQVVLGIVTVLNATPLHWGLVHQIGAVILIVLTLRARFLAKFPVSVSIRGSQV
jgi:cytochrome c oxidase assembly protein subunit 15